MNSTPSPLHIQQASFRLRLSLASKGRNSARETGSPSYLPGDPAPPAPAPAVRITDKRHLWHRAVADNHIQQVLKRHAPKRASLLPLLLACLTTWGAVIAAAWWLLTR